MISVGIGYAIILVAMVIIFIGIIGFFRLPSFYNKMHAASLIDSCGLPLAIFGTIFLQNNLINVIKLFFIILLIFLANPIISYCLGKSSLLDKELNK